MKVKELIEILKEYDENMIVHISYGYGDYWHTQVAPSVNYVEEGLVEYSTYHQMDKVFDTDAYYEDDEEVDECTRKVILIG